MAFVYLKKWNLDKTAQIHFQCMNTNSKAVETVYQSRED